MCVHYQSMKRGHTPRYDLFRSQGLVVVVLSFLIEDMNEIWKGPVSCPTVYIVKVSEDCSVHKHRIEFVGAFGNVFGHRRNHLYPWACETWEPRKCRPPNALVH